MFIKPKTLIQDIFNLLLPSYCVSCNETLSANRDIICNACYSAIAHIDTKQKTLFLERIEEKHFDTLYIKFQFSELLQRLLHYFKYDGYLKLADYFAASIVEELDTTYDIICAVPLHLSKKRERGFNQSEILSQKVCGLLAKKSVEVLQRKRYTPSQTKLSRSQRQSNMYEAFQAVYNVEDKSILLLDDVITTGATLNECAKALKQAAAGRVDIFALATPVDILQDKSDSSVLQY